MAEQGNVFEEITKSECLELLAAGTLGRIAVVADGQPEIFPVNYIFDEGRVAIRTNEGTKLDAAVLSQVAFEIDSVDEDEHTGWSVVVRGTAYDISDSLDEVSRLMRGFPVDTWAPGDKTSWIRIEPALVTGRRIRRRSTPVTPDP
jgi:nitroimidazol reductase NimA-like FMN-containing flavoprotein (pyridoxamine 5'-phosphate oxidase superfamily)